MTVRFIYMAALAGYGLTRIAEILTEKKRPTLKGRTEWNAGMVSGILSNERRWGDLEARKTVVVDYVDHKSKKNEGERVSAYVEGHHEGIATPEIAKAAKLAVSSRATGYSNGMISNADTREEIHRELQTEPETKNKETGVWK